MNTFLNNNNDSNVDFGCHGQGDAYGKHCKLKVRPTDEENVEYIKTKYYSTYFYVGPNIDIDHGTYACMSKSNGDKVLSCAVELLKKPFKQV